MAEECAESSVATSSSSAVVPPNNWWDLHTPGSSALSSWCNNNSNNNNTNTSANIPWHNIQAAAVPNHNSNSDEDVSISTSFTNASNHSGLTVESSRRLVEPAASSSDDLIAEQQTASDNHIWSHVLLNVGNNGDLPNHQDVGENFLDMLSSSKSNISTSGMYEPACNYLKKLDTSNTNWDNQFSNNFDDQKPIIDNGPGTFNESMIENERLTNKLSNLISTWSIAPPEPLEVNNINSSTTTNRHYFNPQTCNISLSSSMDHHLKQTFSDSAAGFFPPCNYVPSLKLENGHSGSGGGGMEAQCPAAARALLRRSFNGASNIGDIGYQIGLNSSFMAADHNSKYHYGMPAPATGPVDSYSSCSSNNTTAKNFADVISFGGRLGKPLIDIHASNSKPCLNKSLGLSDSKKQGLQTTSTPTRSSGRGQGNTSSEGKKKRSEDTSETSLKKPKQENSTASSAKMQAPKVKLGDRITALQQIVSPFGKTDTASVLHEAIQYIKFLQEQVQLLSNPYMKTNSHKDPWGSLDRNKDHHMKGDHVKLDLRSRGLCLVPLSCTPQVYRENTGSDYWTPTYRGCLYR